MLSKKALCSTAIIVWALTTFSYPARAEISDDFLTCSAEISNQVALMKAAYDTGLEKDIKPHDKLRQLQALYINHMYQIVKDNKAKLKQVSEKFQEKITSKAADTKAVINKPDGIKRAISDGYKVVKSCNKKYFSQLFEDAKSQQK